MSEFYIEAYLSALMCPPDINNTTLYDTEPMSLDEALWIANELNEVQYSPFNEPTEVTWVVIDKNGDRV